MSGYFGDGHRGPTGNLGSALRATQQQRFGDTPPRTIHQQGADARAAGVPKMDNPYWVSCYAAEWDAGWEGVNPAKDLHWAKLAEDAGIIGGEYAATIRAEAAGVPLSGPGKHSSHQTRSSDASSFDEICTRCGATDVTGDGWGKLGEPCPGGAAARLTEPEPATEPTRTSMYQAGVLDFNLGKSPTDNPYSLEHNAAEWTAGFRAAVRARAVCDAWAAARKLADPVEATTAQSPSGDFSIGGNLWPGLSKLIEECGEVQQVAGKIVGAEGRRDHWDGTNLRDRLTEELGDLVGAIKFVMEHCELDKGAIGCRSRKKHDLFNKWHSDTLAARKAAS